MKLKFRTMEYSAFKTADKTVTIDLETVKIINWHRGHNIIFVVFMKDGIQSREIAYDTVGNRNKDLKMIREELVEEGKWSFLRPSGYFGKLRGWVRTKLRKDLGNG